MFRLHGDAESVERLRDYCNVRSFHDVDFSSLGDPKPPAHEFAAVLKRFCKELPEAIIPADYDEGVAGILRESKKKKKKREPPRLSVFS
jgi:hypothetical protein